MYAKENEVYQSWGSAVSEIAAIAVRRSRVIFHSAIGASIVRSS